MKEKWEDAYNSFSVGKCYKMHFTNDNRVRNFKVMSHNSGNGTWTGKDCDSCESFDFVKEQWIKEQYYTLREIVCYDCCK